MDATWTNDHPCHFWKNNEGSLLFSLIAVGTGIPGRHWQLLKSHPKSFNAPSIGTDTAEKCRRNDQAENASILCGDFQLPEPNRTPQTAEDRGSNVNGNTRTTESYNTDGSAIDLRVLHSFPTVFAKSFADCGKCLEEPLKRPARGVPRTKNRGEEVVGQIKRHINEATGTRTLVCDGSLHRGRWRLRRLSWMHITSVASGGTGQTNCLLDQGA